MKLAKWLCSCALALAMAGPQTTFAKEPVMKERTQPRMSLPQVTDVALQAGGVLRGSFLDARGVPVKQSKVWVRQQGKLLAETQTDEKGQFEVRRLRGGLYELLTVRGAALFRTWAPGTAPPSTRSSVRLVAKSGDGVVRGQSFADYTFVDPCDPWVQGAIAAAIAGGYFLPPKRTKFITIIRPATR